MSLRLGLLDQSAGTVQIDYPLNKITALARKGWVGCAASGWVTTSNSSAQLPPTSDRVGPFLTHTFILLFL
jgi:hypothetical protein